MLPEPNIPNNTEIEKALKEFDLKSQAEEMQKSPEVLKNSDVPKMVQLVMKWSGLKEQKQAEYILLGFVIVAIVISLFSFFGSGSKQQKISPAVLKQMEKLRPINN